ncbi:MAG: quinone-dependent dihydroorotate dehydrogenase [Flavobacterium sp.]
MYKIFKKIIFLFNPEKAHHLTFGMMKILFKIPFFDKIIQSIYKYENPILEQEIFGIKFKNPVGLAAGLDKNAEYFKELDSFGFGFIEIGTLTPKPQEGNPQPRLFRLLEDQALINRMGFNNKGVFTAQKLLKNKPKNLIIGGNIGKNKDTPNDDAISDYLICFNALYEVVDYFVVNVSSPNTPNLRALQEKEPLKNLLFTLQENNKKQIIEKPILLKIAPDLSQDQLLDIIEIVQETKIAGVIATNTTLDRSNLKSNLKSETGGLSGKPLAQNSTKIIRFLHENSKGSFPIIGVGGITNKKEAIDKINAGASLIQIYSGFIFQGPQLIKDIKKELVKQKLK